MKADRGDIVSLLVDGLVVQRFDVGEGVVEAVAGHAHLVRSEAVKHKGVVRVRAVGNVDFTNGGWYGGHSVP